jgi:hypothetical protein
VRTTGFFLPVRASLPDEWRHRTRPVLERALLHHPLPRSRAPTCALQSVVMPSSTATSNRSTVLRYASPRHALCTRSCHSGTRRMSAMLLAARFVHSLLSPFQLVPVSYTHFCLSTSRSTHILCTLVTCTAATHPSSKSVPGGISA